VTVVGLSPEWWVLIPLAVALGLNLYLVLLGLVLLSHVPGAATPPGDLGSLSGPWAAVAAAGLYGLGWLAGRSRPGLLAWETLHLIVTSVAAGLLGLLVFHERGGAEAWAAALVSAGIAGGVHGLRLGWGTLLEHLRTRVPKPPARSLGEGALALGLLWAALHHPETGSILAGAILLALAASGAPGFRAARFTRHLLRGLGRSLIGDVAWRRGRALPVWIRRSLRRSGASDAIGPRGVPAGLLGVAGAGLFRDGWLVVSPEGVGFHYRRLGRPWRVDLSRAEPVRGRAHEDLLRVDWRDPDGEFALLLPLDAPEEEIVGARRTGPAETRSL
jgi:hypothetical protein